MTTQLQAGSQVRNKLTGATYTIASIVDGVAILKHNHGHLTTSGEAPLADLEPVTPCESVPAPAAPAKPASAAPSKPTA